MSGNTAVVAVAEAQLLEAIRRIGRQAPEQATGRIAFVLHLADLRSPPPRPHHRRIARAILQDAAQRHAGQVFVMRNGDMALLCQAAGLHDSGSRDAGSRDAGSRDAAPRDAGTQDDRWRISGRDTNWRGVSRTEREAASQPSGRASPPPSGPQGGPSALAAALARLLRVDMDVPARLVSIWPLDRDLHLALAYAAARAEERVGEPPPSEDEPAVPPGIVNEISTIVGHARIHDLMQRQTGVVLLGPEARADPAAAPGSYPGPARGADAAQSGPQSGPQSGAQSGAQSTAGGALRPIYREVTFSIAALEARITAGGHASADPFLFRHLAGQLDRRMLDVVRDELGRGGPLDIYIDARGAPPLHLNLTIDAILSPGFAAFADLCRHVGTTAGIEISMLEACADTEAFAAARQAVMRAGLAVVLDGVSHQTLLLTAPWTLEPDLLKLDWSPRLAELSPSDEADVAAAIVAIGPHRVVLQRAGSEAALRWGLANGIRRFQGRHVDAMLGASRIMGCPMSSACSLRQCVERGSATGPAARAGCGNPEMLDAAAPPRHPASRALASREGGGRAATRAGGVRSAQARPTPARVTAAHIASGDTSSGDRSSGATGPVLPLPGTAADHVAIPPRPAPPLAAPSLSAGPGMRLRSSAVP